MSVNKEVLKSNSLLLVTFFVLILFLFHSFPVLAEELIVTDMVGREVAVPERVERIISIYRPATNFLFALGVQERLLNYDGGVSDLRLLKSIKPDLIDLPSPPGGRFSIEEIISFAPELVILSPYGDNLYLANRLMYGHDIPTFVLRVESFDEIIEATELMGQILAKEEQAAAIMEEMTKFLQLTERISSLSEEDKKEVYFANSSLLESVGKGMLQTEMIEMAGGINLASEAGEGFLELSIEELLQMDPEVIMKSQFFREDLDEIRKDSRYRPLNALQEDNIHQFPSNLEPWDFPTPAAFLGLGWLCINLHPELYSDFDWDQMVDDFYTTLYGQDYSQLGGR